MQEPSDCKLFPHQLSALPIEFWALRAVKQAGKQCVCSSKTLCDALTPYVLLGFQAAAAGEDKATAAKEQEADLADKVGAALACYGTATGRQPWIACLVRRCCSWVVSEVTRHARQLVAPSP